MDHAHFERLGELVRELLPLAPELEVYSEAPQCLEAKPGSTLILVPRAEDADWLNINRPLFSMRALRVVLFCTREVSVALLQGAVDFMDWLSLRVECPPGPVPFAVAGLRLALVNRVPGIVWTGGDLETNFAAVRPHHVLNWVSAARPYEDLVVAAKALRPREWLAWTGVDGLLRLRRVRWAMAEARRRTRAILVEPTQSPSDWWNVHGRMMNFNEAREHLNKVGMRYPGRWAALLGLEPESIQLMENISERELHDASLQDAILEGVEPGILVGDRAIAHGLVHEESLFDGRVPIPIMRTRAVLRSSMPQVYSERAANSRDSAEALLWQKPETGDIWQELAHTALSAGDPILAEAWARRAVGDKHTSTSMTADQPNLTAIQTLARTLKAQGRLEEARRQQEYVLEMQIHTLGLEHPETLTAMNNLASTLSAQGHYDEAYRKQERVFEVRLRVLGPEHPSTLTAMNNLAFTLSAQGRLDEARQKMERVLEVRLRILGPEHPDTITAMNNLAAILRAQGRLTEAQQQQERVFEVSLHVLGPEHPKTLTAMSNLASILSAQGRLNEARQKEEHVLEVRLRVLGPEHPDTLTAMGNLAATMHAQGQLEEAQQKEERVLEVRLRVLGTEHPDTLTTMSNLAALLRAQGRLNEAQQRQERVLEVRLRVLGPEHPDTLTSINNLADTLGAQGRLDEAQQRQERVLDVSLHVLGTEHPSTLIIMRNLAQTYWIQGNFAVAKELEETALNGALRTWGETHPNTIQAMSSLAKMRRHLGDTTGAEALEKQAAEIRQRQK